MVEVPYGTKLHCIKNSSHNLIFYTPTHMVGEYVAGHNSFWLLDSTSTFTLWNSRNICIYYIPIRYNTVTTSYMYNFRLFHQVRSPSHMASNLKLFKKFQI